MVKTYAVIESGGKQYKVSEGDEILVDKLSVAKGKEHIFPNVLMLRNEDNVYLGTPYLAGSEVIGKIVDEIKGKKIAIEKFKAKVHYRRKIGFRAKLSRVIIEKIKYEKSKPTAPKIDSREKK